MSLRLLLIPFAVVLLALMAAVYIDYRNFDRTSGGYEPPYTGWTGTPIDWDATERTEYGFRQPGRVVSSHLDCTTGMISFEVAGLSIDYRQVSQRALAVHEPRQACERDGFTPAF